MSESLAPRRVATAAVGLFGLLAAALAVIGVYAVVSYDAARRSKEIAVRVALGATRRSVLMLVLGGGPRLAAIGIMCGTVLAFGIARSARALLFGVEPYDAATYMGLATAFLLVVLAAAFLPAQRAASLDPQQALRNP